MRADRRPGRVRPRAASSAEQQLEQRVRRQRRPAHGHGVEVVGLGVGHLDRGRLFERRGAQVGEVTAERGERPGQVRGAVAEVAAERDGHPLAGLPAPGAHRAYSTQRVPRTAPWRIDARQRDADDVDASLGRLLEQPALLQHLAEDHLEHLAMAGVRRPSAPAAPISPRTRRWPGRRPRPVPGVRPPTPPAPADRPAPPHRRRAAPGAASRRGSPRGRSRTGRRC